MIPLNVPLLFLSLVLTFLMGTVLMFLPQTELVGLWLLMLALLAFNALAFCQLFAGAYSSGLSSAMGLVAVISMLLLACLHLVMLGVVRLHGLYAAELSPIRFGEAQREALSNFEVIFTVLAVVAAVCLAAVALLGDARPSRVALEVDLRVAAAFAATCVSLWVAVWKTGGYDDEDIQPFIVAFVLSLLLMAAAAWALARYLHIPIGALALAALFALASLSAAVAMQIATFIYTSANNTQAATTT